MVVHPGDRTHRGAGVAAYAGHHVPAAVGHRRIHHATPVCGHPERVTMTRGEHISTTSHAAIWDIDHIC
jgi:hypothetical protein